MERVTRGATLVQSQCYSRGQSQGPGECRADIMEGFRRVAALVLHLEGGIIFQQVEKQEVGSWGRRRRVIAWGYGFIAESGHYCPTGLPASNTRHKPNGSERKDLSSVAQLSSVPMESQMEELTTRCSLPHLPEGDVVWVEVL